MFHTNWAHCARITLTSLMVAATLAALIATAAPSQARPSVQEDPGAEYELKLQDQSEKLFGFERPVPSAATTPSSTAPGPQAVTIAKGLTARLVSDRVGENADMIALWPNDDHPTYAIICNEIDGTPAGAAATVQRVRLSDGQVSDMVFGMIACDPSHRTPWGTIIVGEEAGKVGRVWEIFDPLNVNGVTVDRAAGTSSDQTHVITRSALGQVSFEGIAQLADGTTYYGDELRPANGKAGGGIYKFVPAVQRVAGAGPLTSLDQSPLVGGSVYVLRVGIRNGGTDFGQGTNIGAGMWIGPLSTATDLAAAAIAAGGYTGYYRPEDMDIDPIALAKGQVRACWPNTGNDAGETWGEVLCFTDDATSLAGFATGTRPVVSPFVIGNPDLRMPDNVDFQPGTGILYVLMDATTSAENPAFANDDVWACLPDGADSDVLSDGCVRVMTLKDGAAEFTGIQFLGDGKSFLIHLQHRTQDGRAVPHTTDELLISGLKIRDH
jgi:secreted PhoX family phosphatase